jgi:hypothetical protein
VTWDGGVKSRGKEASTLFGNRIDDVKELEFRV